MNATTCRTLIELNRTFYTTFGGDFARTRRSWPPGFTRILPHLYPAANVIDVGCGNARLLAFLASQGWQGAYLGVDSSRALLAEAQRVAAAQTMVTARFVEADLWDTAWPEKARAAEITGGDAVACLAVLHHIPGAANRSRCLAQCAALLNPRGRLIVSTWQFMTSERLRGRTLPWEKIGVRPDEVEPGDYLVSWGAGAAGIRYCAYIDRIALERLAEAAGLSIVETFCGDGHEGNLNLYGVLTAR